MDNNEEDASASQPAVAAAARRPIMRLLEQLGRKGTLRILWELRDGAPQSFRALRTSTEDMSPSVLNDRLKELRAAGIVELSGAGYVLTEAGGELVKRLTPLNQWANRWIE
ncbi:DNA-binding HxlR family transcriptional regulator [Variovorax boronicumulans]|jgi:DNA-binding HxlR family transcriptional regulator|uniref:winged helix-turn-helix transcriptional regulator n=1 Tax=Variovorax boronicumulans TaxID=436515 RepID=UPI00277D17B6|nr:helix-turn-helix domain-containing protein [Variovorax boronicumulans]MDQ0070183.1 DNA-binding HxlR family transcriptional regulator [Variovorax boronicumulans]